MFEGIVEVRSSSVPATDTTTPWGTVCSFGGFKNEDRAAPSVVCGHMGFSNASAYSATRKNFGRPPTASSAAAPILLTSVDCSAEAARRPADASEYNLNYCAFVDATAETSKCLHSDDSGVSCVPSSPAAWEFKLVNASRPSRGLLLMRPMAGAPWGTVANDLLTTSLNARRVA